MIQQKNIQNGIFVFLFFKKNKTLFLSKTPKKRIKKTDLFKKNGFFVTMIIFQLFFVIFAWSHDLEQVTSLSVWLGVHRTPRVKVPGNEEAENYWHLNAQA